MPASAGRRFCSGCGQEMEWRLSRWECRGCGSVEDPAEAEAAQRRQQEMERKLELKNNIRSLQSKPVYSEGEVVGLQTGDELRTMQAPPPSSFLDIDPEVYGLTSEVRRQRLRSPALELEKKIFFAALAVGVGCAVIFGLYSSAMMPRYGWVYALAVAASGGLWIYFSWLALFSDQVWSKWCCGGAQALSLVGTIASVVLLVGFNSDEFQSLDFQLRGMLSGILWGGVVAHALFVFWLIGILYRDLRVMRDG